MPSRMRRTLELLMMWILELSKMRRLELLKTRKCELHGGDEDL